METPRNIGDRRFSPHTRLELSVFVTATVLMAVVESWRDPAVFTPWSGDPADGRDLLRWLVAAWTEAEFFTSALAGAGLLMGAYLATYAETTRQRWRGFGLACGSGLWPWTVTSSALGLLLSNFLWGWTLRSTGLWQPTFVPVVSVAPALVLAYGPGWRTAMTGAALSALVVAPSSIAATDLLCRPLAMPLVAGVTGGMALGALVSFALCRVLPWLPPHLESGLETSCDAPIADVGLVWALRRMLADFSEAQFFGNEWASAGLILGVLLADRITPNVPVYGSGLLKEVLAAQGLTAIVGMLLWRRAWVRRGFYPTFVPIVSVAPAAVLTFEGTRVSIVAGAVLGALIGPPLAAAISSRLPTGFHPFIGNVASMAISTAVIIPALRLLHAAA